MPCCIFCDTQLGPDTTEEHIIHDCLGGRETTSEVLCSHHNNLFGGTIDDAFAEPLLPIRNLMQFRSGSGRPPPMLRGLQAGDDLINVFASGEIQLANPAEATRDIFAYIEGFYNRTRRHSAIGYISPIEMELKAA